MFGETSSEKPASEQLTASLDGASAGSSEQTSYDSSKSGVSPGPGVLGAPGPILSGASAAASRHPVYVALFRDASGAVGKLIRWQTRSRYSHAALVFDRSAIRAIDPTCSLFLSAREWKAQHELTHQLLTIEAREFRGVRLTAGIVTTPETNVDLFEVCPAKCLSPVGPVPDCSAAASHHQGEAFRKVWQWAKGELSKEYDYTMVARFISRRQASRTESDKWFCSELVFAALRKAGIELLRDVEPWAVSPGLLAKSPLLKFVKTIGPQPLNEISKNHE